MRARSRRRVSRRGYLPRQVIAAGTYAWPALIPAMLFAPNVYVLGLILGVALTTAPSWNAVIGAYRIALTRDRLQGRVQRLPRRR